MTLLTTPRHLLAGSCHTAFAARPTTPPHSQSRATTTAALPVASTATVLQTADRRDHRGIRQQPQPFLGLMPARWDGQQGRPRLSRRSACTGPASCRAQGSPNSSTPGSSVAASQYLGRGPYTASQPVPLKFRVGQGRSGALDCTLNVFLPNGGPQQQSPGSQRWPLLVLSSGFLLHSGLYGSYAADLASWGLAVALYDVPELVDDVTMGSALGLILDACTSDPRVSPYVDARAILLAGHSRGGKLSVLTAASDPRVKGIALLDPVDVTGMTPTGPGYPSALPAMRLACGPPRSVPALVVGAARNTGVVPANANYKRFVASCPGPCWFLELTGAGHLQFLDAKVDLFSAFVESGPTPDEAVRRVSKAAVLAWALELAVPLARGEPISGRQVVERLQMTSTLLERQAPLLSSFKGFDTLTGSAGSGAAAGAAGARGPSGSTSSSSSSSSSSASSYGTGAASWSDSAARGTGTGPERGPGASSSRAASATGGGASTSGGGGGVGGHGWSYEQLMGMRARELKAILVDRGVDCSDCFEKADLARRIMERC